MLKRVSLMETSRADLGRRSEQLARTLLIEQGYVIERTNVRVPVGEIDILARDGNALCFIEVRSTRSTRWGGALASIGERKRQRLIRAAQWHLSRRPQAPEEIRFDVVAIDWQERAIPRVELVRGAFDATGPLRS